MTDKFSSILHFGVTEKELGAIKQMSSDLDMSHDAVLRQALRHYQLLHERLKAGETFSFSGDEHRAREFASGAVL